MTKTISVLGHRQQTNARDLMKTYIKPIILSVGLGSASVLHADVTADDVWSMFYDQAVDAGFVVNALREKDGKTLVVSDLTMTFNDDINDVNVIYSPGQMSFVQLSDDTVVVDMPERSTWNISFRDEYDEIINVDATQIMKGAQIQVSERQNALVWNYDIDTLTFVLERVTDDSEIIERDQLDVQISLKGSTGSTSYAQNGANDTKTTWKSDALEIDAMISPVGEMLTAQIRTRLADISLLSSMKMPNNHTVQDLEKALGAGAAISANYQIGAGNTQITYTGPEGNLFINTDTMGTVLDTELSQEGLKFDTRLNGLGIDAKGDMLPTPSFTAGIGAIEYGLTFPLMSGPDVQELGLKYIVSDVSFSDSLWQTFDPFGAFEPSPFSIGFDVTMALKVAADFFDPQELVKSDLDDVTDLGELISLSLNKFIISGLGAEIAADAYFTFDSTDLITFGGIPRPQGDARLRINGLNALMDKMSSLGLLDAEQVMGARMFMGMFTVPVGRDQLETDIRIDEMGGIFANGQQIQ